MRWLVKKPFIVILLCLSIISGAKTISAGEGEIQFDYDIFWVGDTLSCWLDPTPALTQQKMEDLLSGLDIYFHFEIKLEIPRKLFFKKTLIKSQAALLISRQLTEDIYQVRFSGFEYNEYEFDSQIQVSDFLADSLVFGLVSRSVLEKEGYPYLNLSLSCKSLHPRGMPGHREDRLAELMPVDSGEGGFFDGAFGLFLDLIGYGETTYKIKSPVFNPDNLDSFDR